MLDIAYITLCFSRSVDVWPNAWRWHGGSAWQVFSVQLSRVCQRLVYDVVPLMNDDDRLASQHASSLPPPVVHARAPSASIYCGFVVQQVHNKSPKQVAQQQTMRTASWTMSHSQCTASRNNGVGADIVGGLYTARFGCLHVRIGPREFLARSSSHSTEICVSP